MNIVVRFVDLLPRLPYWILFAVGAVIGVNGLLGLVTDYRVPPWWVSLPLLAVWFLFLFKADRAKRPLGLSEAMTLREGERNLTCSAIDDEASRLSGN